MLAFHPKRGVAFLRCLVLGVLLVGVRAMAVEAALSDDSATLLQRADQDRTSNFEEFVQLLQKLDTRTATLSPRQRVYLRFLSGWKAGYEGDYGNATLLLQSVVTESDDLNLRLRAGFVMVNILSDESRYEEAFALVSKLLEQLPLITDPKVREKALGSVAELYKEAGQYELALSYVDQQLKEVPEGDSACIARYVRIATLYKSGQLKGIQSQFDLGLQSCQKANDILYANGINFIIASLDVKQNHLDRAIALLQKNVADVQRVAYPPLIAQFSALLAEAYLDKDDATLANQYALAAVAAMGKNEVAESLATAYRVLYLVSRKSGDMPQALAYHEKYMAADKGYLNEVSARSLAFQVVNQQVLAKKLQLDTLTKQNQILELQQSLDAKAAEASRLYIILLLTIVASIGLWTYRLKRSQMSYMRQARRDGLTGIFNREHFVASAERQLRHCQKSSLVAGLIVIDLDNFKITNDTHGHAVGDHVLKRAVAACEAHLRSTDVFGRLGGEEFGILMPECDSDIVTGRAELIRTAIASVSDSEGALGVTVSASFGVSSTAHSGYNLRQLLIHADKALYAAKHGGRNCVRVFAEGSAGFHETLTATPLSHR